MTTAAEHYDRVVIGAGIFGLHAARVWAGRGRRVAVIDADVAPMMRSSYVNQARLHYGYHYPRSLTTALSSIKYYDRFMAEFSDCINATFTKIYAIARSQSLISTAGFERFCAEAEIPCYAVNPARLFRSNVVDAAYETQESSFDSGRIRTKLVAEVAGYRNVDWHLGRRIADVVAEGDTYRLRLDDDTVLTTDGVLNATYAGLNQILRMFDTPPLGLKYELCEIVLTEVEGSLGNSGITVMDGDYFSLMPFGATGYFSLTTVDYTPRLTSRSQTPQFPCQAENGRCNDTALDHCTYCPARPKSAWRYAHQRAIHYLNPQHRVHYRESLYTVKTVLQQSEIDDSRPTLIQVHRTDPWLASVLSGKVATIYDLEEIL